MPTLRSPCYTFAYWPAPKEQFADFALSRRRFIKLRYDNMDAIVTIDIKRFTAAHEAAGAKTQLW